MDRIIGRVSSGKKGPLLIAIGAMHGNEPSGIAAIERVFDILGNNPKGFKGTFLGVVGNKGAFEKKHRYLNQDLNRIWTNEDLHAAYNYPNGRLMPEHVELRDLHRLIMDELEQQYEEVVVLDLHTTSANGGVFIACTDDEVHRDVVRRLHVPVILNLAEDLEGTAMQYFWERGITAFAFEGGNHYNPESVNKMESALWVTLAHMGCINHRTWSNVEYHDKRLIASTEGLPHFCQLVYHHSLHLDDQFEMKPGYANFQAIEQGEVLAHDRNGVVVSPVDGRILMPLYQQQGTDGFFIVKELN